MTTDEPFLVVSGLGKVFGRRGAAVPAVHDVSFTLGRGESLAIVGESGSGKTTIARILIGLETATTGTVRVDGQERTSGRVDLRERRRRARQLQIVFQDPYSSLDPRQTVAAAIEEVVRLHGSATGDRQARVGELLEQVGLDDRLGRARPQGLSGGQRQRAAIARALAAEPTVLILDEAVAALDVSIQAQILNLLADIRAARSLAYLFISHDLAVVRQVCDRALVMRAGVCVEQGSTEQVLDRPAHPYTAELRASVPGPGWRPAHRAEPAAAATGPT